MSIIINHLQPIIQLKPKNGGMRVILVMMSKLTITNISLKPPFFGYSRIIGPPNSCAGVHTHTHTCGS